MAPVAVDQHRALAQHAVGDLERLVALVVALLAVLLRLLLVFRHLGLAGFGAGRLAAVAGVRHALLLGLLGVVQALLRLLLALLLTGLLLLLSLALLLLAALHGMKLRIELVQRLRKHLGLELLQRRCHDGRRGLAGSGFGGLRGLGGIGLALLRGLGIRLGIGLLRLGLLASLLNLVAGLGDLLRRFFLAKALLVA